MGAAFGDRDHADLREGGLLAPMGGRTTKRRLVGGGVGHVQAGPIDRQQPPAPIPGALGVGGGQRPGDLDKQSSERLGAQPGAGLGDRRRARHPPPLLPAAGPLFRREPTGDHVGQ